MENTLTVQPGILEIALYQAGKATLEFDGPLRKLSSNENPYGPSPKAIAAMQHALIGLERYPSTDHADLRAAIGAAHGLDPERIICGVGSDEVLQFVTQCYAGVGDEVIYTEHGFSMYPLLARAQGAVPVKVAERDRQVDIENILDACTSKTRLVFLTNPGNPTGTFIAEDVIADLATRLPAHIVLVLDGAYAEFAEGYDGGVSIVDAHENVILTRTFSKLYGLGGLRLGWGYAQKSMIDVLNRVRQPFNLNNLQIAGGIAAVNDQDYAQKTRDQIVRSREALHSEIVALGIACDPSHTNFLLLRFEDEAEAGRVDAAFQQSGIIVRRVAGYGFPEGLRITVGTEDDCAAVLGVLREAMEQ